MNIETADQLAGQGIYRASRLLPKAPPVDYLINLCAFVCTHRRFPQLDKFLYNDYLFLLKHSAEALHPLRQYVSDNEYLKEVVSGKIGDAYRLPTLRVLTTQEKAKEFSLPLGYMLRPTHLNGEYQSGSISRDAYENKIEEWFRSSTYLLSRQTALKQLKPKLLVEPAVFDDARTCRYSVYCVNGIPRLVEAKMRGLPRQFHTRFWEHIPVRTTPYPVDATYKKPLNLGEILSIAETLSQDFSFIRVDLCSNGDFLYVLEMVTCPDEGLLKLFPENAEGLMTTFLFTREEFNSHWQSMLASGAPPQRMEVELEPF